METTLSIVVTDSGLGGLSVMAELEKNLSENPIAGNIRLTFFNALADKKCGYNTMISEEEKVNVFNAALEGMVQWYNPDIIFIACNTLSVVYPKTNFAKETNLNVLGIVDFGVDLVYHCLLADKHFIAIMLGTPTTIDSGAHKKKLLERGIKSDRIVEQPCYMLESAIQVDPFSNQTRHMIKEFMTEAKKKIAVEYKGVCVVLCCTHYGYSCHLFEEELQNTFSCPVQVLNPNSSMSSYLTVNTNSNIDHSKISAKVVSRVNVFPEEISVLGELLKNTSEKVYESLTNYSHKKELFNFTSQ